MKKWVCSVCGYVFEGENAPAECPVCHASSDKFVLQAQDRTWAAEHVVGVGKAFGNDVPEDVKEKIIEGLHANFQGECRTFGPGDYPQLGWFANQISSGRRVGGNFNHTPPRWR